MRTHALASIVSFCLTIATSFSAGQEPLAPGEDWFAWSMPWDSSVVDLSRLADAPAGKHGFLTAKGREFQFEDGTPIKFWGANVVAIACMPEKADAPVLASVIRARGFNLVRFHYYDSTWAGDPGETTLIDYAKGDSQHWNEDKLDRMFYFINEIKKQGVYTMLDANSGREYLKGDGLPTPLPARARGHAIFVERLIELQQDMIKRLFSRVNPYTGLAAKDDPAIAILNINNENDCLYGGVNWSLEPYGSEMKRRYIEWAKSRNAEADAPELSQIDFHPRKRSDQATQFLMEVQKQYQERMAGFCRQSAGIRAMLCGDNWNMGLFVPLTQKSMDISDVHIYETHPNKDTNNIANRSILRNHELRFHSRMLLKVDGKPFFCSEWDHRLPVETRAEYPCFLATQAVFGGWAGLIHFCALTSNERIDHVKGINNSWSDPAIYGLFPHAALLYRRDAQRARQTVVMRVDPATVDVMEQTFPAQIMTPEVHDFLVSMDRAPAADFVVGANERPVPADLDPIVSDTGEFRRSVSKEHMIIDTDGTQVITANFKKSQCLSTKNMTVRSENDFAVFALSSLTDAPISSSDDLLLTTIGRAYAKGIVAEKRDGLIYYTPASLGGSPTLLEPVKGRVAIAVTTPRLSVRAINARGEPLATVPSRVEDGALVFEVGRHNTMYYAIKGGK